MNHSFPQKAMILAAGLGERLRPLTLTTPKPLIPIEGRPLITYNIALLRKAGVKEVMINLHHLGEKIQNTLGDGKAWEMKFHYSFEKEVLGTGGGIKNVESFFGEESFIVMNGDVLIDVDLAKLWRFHQSEKPLASLLLSSAEREDVKRLVYLNSQNKVLSISESPPQENVKGYVFTGVQIVGPEVLKILPGRGVVATPKAGEPSHYKENISKSCIVQNAYLPLLEKKEKISGFICEGYFRDLGTAKRYEEVQKEFSKHWPYTTLKLEDFVSE